MSVFKLFISVLLCLSLSFFAVAEDASFDEISKSDCAIEQGSVVPGDASLCSEDIAFGILYEMFPSLFEEIMPFWSLDEFNAAADGEIYEPMLLGTYYGDQVFFVLFKLFYQLVMLIGGVYIGFIVLSVLIRALRGKPINGDNPHQDNPKTWSAGSFIGGLMLIPYKTFFVGQLLIFSSAIGALSLANFAFSFVLATQQQVFESTLDHENRNAVETTETFIDRHDYLASAYYRYLVKMSLCRDETTNLIVSQLMSEVDSVETLNKIHGCAYGMDDTFSMSQSYTLLDDVSPFIWPKVSLLSGKITNKDVHESLSSIDFGVRSLGLSCSLVDGHTFEYECGSIEIHKGDFSDNALVILLGETLLFSHLDSLALSLTPDLSESEVQSVVTAGWAALYSDIEKAVDSYSADYVSLGSGKGVVLSDSSKTKVDALEFIKNDKERTSYRKLSLAYHINANNLLAFGRAWSRTDVGSWFDSEEPNRIPDFESTSRNNFDSLFYRQKQADVIAAFISEAQCMDRFFGLNGSKNLLSYLTGESSSMPIDSHARCLDWNNKVIKGDIADRDSMTSEELMVATSSKYEQIVTDFKAQWLDTVETYAAQRRAVEASYNTSMEEIDVGSWWVRMRQEGYLAAANYFFFLNKEVEGYKSDLRFLSNTFSEATPTYDEKYVSETISYSDGVIEQFPTYKFGDDLFNGVDKSGLRIDPLVSRYHWLAKQQQLLRQPELYTSDAADFQELFNFAFEPMKNLTRLGLDLDGSGKDNVACLTDPDECAFPLTDPMVELSAFGHDMVNVGTSFYSLALGAKLVSELAYRLPGDRENGDIGQKAIVKPSSKLFAVADAVGVASEYMFSSLATVMAIYMVVGALLAYILPLLPFLFLYFNFVSWVMVVVMASFSILLWALYWVRFKEKRHILKEAGLHFGIEMWLKPLFSLITVLFAYYFFFVVAFLVANLSDWLSMLPFDGDGGMGTRALIDPLLSWIMIAFIYYIGLTFSLKLKTQMMSELMEKLGVRDMSAKDSNMGSFLQIILYQNLVDKLTKTHQSMAKDPVRSGLEQRVNKSKEDVKKFQRDLAKVRASQGENS